MKNLRVAIYIRVSTQDQSLDLQRHELTTFAAARGWTLTQVFEEKLSGTNAERPQLKAMMKAAAARDFDILLIFKLDRLFRSIKGLVSTIAEFEALGVKLVSLKDAVDLSTPSGRFMVHILAAVGELEVSLIRERVNAGLAEARRKGVILGRPKSINEFEVRRLRGQGHSIAQIASKLGCSKAGIFKVLGRVVA